MQALEKVKPLMPVKAAPPSSNTKGKPTQGGRSAAGGGEKSYPPGSNKAPGGLRKGAPRAQSASKVSASCLNKAFININLKLDCSWWRY